MGEAAHRKHRILAIRFQNLACADLELDTEGLHVLVRGPNGGGKTVLLDTIAKILSGKGKDTPLRVGASRGEGCVELDGGVTVRRRFREGKTPVLSILDERGRSTTGVEGRSPAEFLKHLCRAGLAFNPIKFDQLTALEQRAALLRAAGVDFTQLDRQREAAFQDRRDLKRDLKRAEAQLDDLTYSESWPDQPADDARLRKERDALYEMDRKRRSWLQSRDAHVEDIKRIEEALIQAKRRLERFLEKQEEPPDVGPRIGEVDRLLEHSTEINKQHARKVEYMAKRDEVLALEQQVDASDATIKEIDQERSRAIQAADIGIPGLSITTDKIEVNGVPFAELNTETRLRLGLRLAIRENPDLGVVLLDECNRLDPDNISHYVRVAEQEDVQLWVVFRDRRVAEGIEVEPIDAERLLERLGDTENPIAV